MAAELYYFWVFLAAVSYSSLENKVYSEQYPKFHTRSFRIRKCSPKFSHIANHTACLSTSPYLIRHGVSAMERKRILDEHNHYRGIVQPAASNMLKLTWDGELAMIAQAWADTCQFRHDPGEHRVIPGRFSVGQNIGEDHPDWPSLIAAWYNEKNVFVYNGTTKLHDVGHYTQMVWADTVKIGCGFAECESPSGKHKYRVCNYGPQGNLGGHSIPYKAGRSCSDCLHRCVNRLCDCGTKVCLNGATMNRARCTCICYQPFHVGDTCQLNCTLASQLEAGTSSCGRPPFDKKDCTVYGNEPDACPVLCGICPYADANYTEVGETPSPLPGRTTQPSIAISRATHAQCTVMLTICSAALMEVISRYD